MFKFVRLKKLEYVAPVKSIEDLNDIEDFIEDFLGETVFIV